MISTRVVFDAVAVQVGSAEVTLNNLVRAWRDGFPDDLITVLFSTGRSRPTPPGVHSVEVDAPLRGYPGELWRRSFGVRRAARSLQPDLLVSVITASAFLGAGCSRAVIVHDLRHEARPEQFDRRQRLERRLGYGWSLARADKLICVSDRTRTDVLARPHRRRRIDDIVVAWNGADHAGRRPTPLRTQQPYALAFGNFANKNASSVIRAWRPFHDAHPDFALLLVGMPESDRSHAERLARDCGVEDSVRVSPWLGDDDFDLAFAGAALVVYPSDFEGFGMPAAEAMRLRIPLVVSDDPALLEVTGGHASVTGDLRPQPLAAAMSNALDFSTGQLDAAQAYARRYTWSAMAERIRAALTGFDVPAQASVRLGFEGTEAIPSAEDRDEPRR